MSDLISRNEMLRTYQELCRNISCSECSSYFCDALTGDCLLEKWIHSLPSARPELIKKAAYIRGFEQGRTQGIIDSQGGKKGEWLELTNTNHSYVCSVCGRMLVNITDGKNMVTKKYPFCHCGADMRGEQE